MAIFASSCISNFRVINRVFVSSCCLCVRSDRWLWKGEDFPGSKVKFIKKIISLLIILYIFVNTINMKSLSPGRCPCNINASIYVHNVNIHLFIFINIHTHAVWDIFFSEPFCVRVSNSCKQQLNNGQIISWHCFNIEAPKDVKAAWKKKQTLPYMALNWNSARWNNTAGATAIIQHGLTWATILCPIFGLVRMSPCNV